MFDFDDYIEAESQDAGNSANPLAVAGLSGALVRELTVAESFSIATELLHRQAFQFHPDIAENDDYQERFREVSEALERIECPGIERAAIRSEYQEETEGSQETAATLSDAVLEHQQYLLSCAELCTSLVKGAGETSHLSCRTFSGTLILEDIISRAKLSDETSSITSEGESAAESSVMRNEAEKTRSTLETEVLRMIAYERWRRSRPDQVRDFLLSPSADRILEQFTNSGRTELREALEDLRKQRLDGLLVPDMETLVRRHVAWRKLAAFSDNDWSAFRDAELPGKQEGRCDAGLIQDDFVFEEELQQNHYRLFLADDFSRFIQFINNEKYDEDLAFFLEEITDDDVALGERDLLIDWALANNRNLWHQEIEAGCLTGLLNPVMPKLDSPFIDDETMLHELSSPDHSDLDRSVEEKIEELVRVKAEDTYRETLKTRCFQLEVRNGAIVGSDEKLFGVGESWVDEAMGHIDYRVIAQTRPDFVPSRKGLSWLDLLKGISLEQAVPFLSSCKPALPVDSRFGEESVEFYVFSLETEGVQTGQVKLLGRLVRVQPAEGPEHV